MTEPATTRPAAAPRSNGGDSGDPRLQELRRLLVGSEQARLVRLEGRLDDPEVRAQEIARVLPNARIRKSLEQVLKVILTRDPELVADAVRPIILASVKKAVADALREFAESLSQIAEKSVSWRALQWRFEAFRTGKKFSEIVLSRSLLYSVREVFLIHNKTGVLLQQATKDAVANDGDMISSMFSAIQEFVRDSFIGTENRELETIDLGSFKLWIQHGTHAIIAGAVSGSPPMELKGVFRQALDGIEKDYAQAFEAFKGDVTPFESTRPILERCLLGQSGPKPRRSIVPWLVFALVVAGALGWAGYAIVQQYRWNDYVRKLSAEPGIVLTRVEKEGSKYVVSGFRDDLAHRPADLLANTKIPPAEVLFRLTPFLSREPRFVAARQLNEDKRAIENSVIRFQQSKSDLSSSEQDNIDEIGRRFVSLQQAANAIQKTVGIQLLGHTDDMGSEEMNTRLSQDRAERVAAALVADGIDRRYLIPLGIATSRPLRAGSTERSRSFNRSVSFIVTVH